MNAITQQIEQESETLPPALQEQVLDFVRFLKYKAERSVRIGQPDDEPNGTKLARLMTEIAERGTAFKEIEDPVVWQRETRKDRPLPNREG